MLKGVPSCAPSEQIQAGGVFLGPRCGNEKGGQGPSGQGIATAMVVENNNSTVGMCIDATAGARGASQREAVTFKRPDESAYRSVAQTRTQPRSFTHKVTATAGAEIICMV